jgi:hypothetical protein
MPALPVVRRTRRIAPAGLMCLSVLVGWTMVFGPRLPVRSGRLPAGRFVAYRGPHRPGDMIGPNARVVTIDGEGNPRSVVSTDGNAPVVWAFELADPSRVAPLPGQHVHRFGRDPWVHPACPSPMCPSRHVGPAIPSPPPPLPLDICGALSVKDLVAILGPGPFSASAPTAGVCVWDNGRAGVQVEAGGREWWSYLAGLPALYRPVAAGDDELVDTRAGLHVAVRRGPVTVVLLTYANESVPAWARIAQEVAAWVATR